MLGHSYSERERRYCQGGLLTLAIGLVALGIMALTSRQLDDLPRPWRRRKRRWQIWR